MMNTDIFTPEKLVISKPELLQAKHRIGGFVTLILFWSVFLYMLRPIFILAGWFISVHVLNDTISLDSLQSSLLEPVGDLMYLLIFMLVLFPGWMMYNKFRFIGVRDRRARAEHRTVNEIMSEKINIPSELYEKAVNSRAMVCCFDEAANVVDIKELVPIVRHTD